MKSKGPKDWENVRLEDVVKFNPRESIKKGAISKKIGMDRLLPFQRKIDGFEMAEFKGGTKFRNGDTLLARITPCLENGKTAQVTVLDNEEIGFGSTEYIVLREKPSISINDFIYYLAISPKVKNVAIKSMTGTSGRQRAQRDVIENLIIDFPPLYEQKLIADTLSALDDKIELNNKINENLEQQAQAIFKHWFVDFEFPDENRNPYKSSGGQMIDSELGMIPKGWEVKSLDEIADYLNGIAIAKHKPTKETENSLPAIKIRELRQGYTDDSSDQCLTTIDEKYIVNNFDMIFSWSGSLLIDIWVGGKAILNQHLFKVTSEQHYQWYYYYWTKHFLDEFIEIARNKATTMGHINRSHLSEAKILLPNLRIYEEMDRTLGNMLKLKMKKSKQNQKLSQLRDTLLPRLMSGEIRIPLD